MTPASLLTRSTAVLALAGALSASPLQLRLDPGAGLWPVGVPAALARGGGDDGGSDDSGGGSDDTSGSDDHGGSSGGAGGGSGGGSDDRSDDRSGSNRGRDDSANRNDAKERRSAQSGANSAHEAMLADGSKIEIENGRVEIKNADGRTIVERPATAEDRALLQQASTRAGATGRGGADLPPRDGTRGGGLVARVEVSGENIEIIYSDGWTEEIENGRYQLKDAANRTLVERTARAADRDRLFAAVR